MRRLAAAVAAGAVLVLPAGTALVAAGAVLVLPAGTALAATSQSTASPTSASGATPSTTPSAGPSASTSASSGGAAANPLCSAEVVDSAGVLSGDDVEQLRSAGQDLGQTTLLRVRTVSQVDGGDLNAYEKQLQQSCGWADASNHRQPTLLVVMVDTDDRQMGIYPGPALTPVLTDKVWLAIEQDAMRPSFAGGDWTAGLQAGIEALDQLVGPGAAPSASFDPSAVASAAASASDAPASQPAAGVGVGLAPPTGSGGGSDFPIVGVGIAAVAVLGLVGAATTAVRRNSLRRPFGGGSGWEPGQSSGIGFTDGGSSFGGGDGGGGGGSSSDGGGGSSGF